MPAASSARSQTLLAVVVLAIGAAVVAGATTISSEAGYAGVGPNFLPWVVGLALVLIGALMLWEARTGGFRQLEPPSGAERGFWPGFAWLSAALLLNAALITFIGFILSCTLCFVLAVRGLRSADQQGVARPLLQPGELLRDVILGLLISAPVYWMFTQLLAISLPGLTSTGWI